jgi:hypothetical protein
MMMEFDFGPISRTVDASTGKGDAINFASLPVHEVMTALLAATDRDEFGAWLWHDLFKPLFWWRWNSQKAKFDWIHYPSTKVNNPLGVEKHWSTFTKVPSGLVGTHHYWRGHKFTLKEQEAITNEFNQITLGKETCFLQLALLAEPATNTALLRAVIADAFMEVVTKAAAQAIKQELAKKQPTFSQVRYVFECKKTQFSKPPTNAEIEALRDQYDMKFRSDALVIIHIIPVASADLDGQQVEVKIDFNGSPLTPEQLVQEIITLGELLTVYQDSRTIVMGLPQFLQIDVKNLEKQVKAATEQRLQKLDIRTLAAEKDLKKQARTRKRVDWEKLSLEWEGQNVDLLAHVFAEQVKIRLIDGKSLLTKIQYKKGRKTQETKIRPLSEVVSWPVELLQGKSRRCRFCNSAFESVLPPSKAKVGGYFTDIEHVGLGGDICPMCRIYVLNSHKSRTAAEKAKGITSDRKGYRGAFALLMPTSHFIYAEDQCRLVEQPPLDVGGRFANPLQRATVTLQEYALFNMLSRRIIARIWTQLEDTDETQPLPLPYLGAILLTQDKFAQVQALFDCLEMLFEEVVLSAYPFEVTVQPAVELAFEMAVNDLQKHHTKHTYLKTSPTIVSADPESKFTLLVDNNLQLEVNRQFFADRDRLVELLNSIRGQQRQHNWLLSVLQGNDPVTATAETFYDRSSFYKAEDAFWSTHMEEGSPAEQWSTYEEVRKKVEQIVSRYPLLIEFFRR